MNRLLVHLPRARRPGPGRRERYYEAVKADLLARRVDPYEAAARLLAANEPREDGPSPSAGGRGDGHSGPGHAAHLDRDQRSRWAGTTRTV